MSRTSYCGPVNVRVEENGVLVDGDMDAFFHARQEWSFKTFGPASERGARGPLKHLAEEVTEAQAEAEHLLELREAGFSGEATREALLEELVDLQFLVHDAVSREGFYYEEFLDACWKKLAKNRARRWGARSVDGVVEHIREGE